MADKPTLLLHYTSWDAFNGMLKPMLDEKEPKPFLRFHASQIHMMNDKFEDKLILDSFYTDSGISEEIKKDIKQVQNEIGETFVVSMSQYDNSFHQGYIPMWLMYASNGQGVELVFDYKKLVESNEYRLIKCEYIYKSDATEVAGNLRNPIKEKKKQGQDLKDDIKELLYAFPKFKEKHWEYEHEYRIVFTKKNPLYKVNRLGLINYQEIDIPIDALRKITIGPTANKEVLIHTLESLQGRVRTLGVENVFKIEISKLKLQ